MELGRESVCVRGELLMMMMCVCVGGGEGRGVEEVVCGVGGRVERWSWGERVCV